MTDAMPKRRCAILLTFGTIPILFDIGIWKGDA
jgi:hypothetical protein